MAVTLPLYTGLGPRPPAPSAGELRFNSTNNVFEAYNGSSWSAVSYPGVVRQLISDTGTVYGKTYLTICPVGYNWQELTNWLTDTFGSTSEDGVWTPSMRWYINNDKIWFKNSKDRDWFVLRWS